MKASNEHIPFLDFLRGLAILFVFVCHVYYDNFSPFQKGSSWNGWFLDLSHPWNEGFLLATGGVAIFFVVSGFCVHLSHGRSRDQDLGIFFLRRFFRIYPPYLLALLIFTFIYPLTRLDFSSTLLHTRPQYEFSLLQLVMHMALIHNLSVYTLWSINGVFWTIGVEVQLYCLYPLLLFLAKRMGWLGVLWMTAVIELGMRAYSVRLGFDAIFLSQHDPAWLTKDPLFFWFSWTVGAALAEAYLKGQTLPFQGRSLLLFPVLAVISGQIKPLTPFTFPLIALSTVYIASHWLKNPSRAPSSTGRGAFVYNHLRYAGMVSYSFYLLHGPLLSSFGQALNKLLAAPAWITALLCLPAWFLILGVAYVFYRFVELPSIAWGKRAIEMRRQRIAQALASPVAVES